MKLFSKYSNLCDDDTQRRRGTDGRTIYHSNTELCVASRVKNWICLTLERASRLQIVQECNSVNVTVRCRSRYIIFSCYLRYCYLTCVSFDIFSGSDRRGTRRPWKW